MSNITEVETQNFIMQSVSMMFEVTGVPTLTILHASPVLAHLHKVRLPPHPSLRTQPRGATPPTSSQKKHAKGMIKFEKKVVFKMHFKPFQAILDHVFFNFFGWVPRENFKKKLKKHDLKWLKMT